MKYYSIISAREEDQRSFQDKTETDSEVYGSIDSIRELFDFLVKM